MPVQGRPTRIHDLVSMVYGNGGAMVLPNYGMNDARQLDELPNRALVEQEGFVFEELLELTSLAEQAGLLEPVMDLTEERVNEEGDTAPVTTLYALTPQGTGVARERADAAHRAALEETVEAAAASAAEQATERALDAMEAVTVEVPDDAVTVDVTREPVSGDEGAAGAASSAEDGESRDADDGDGGGGAQTTSTSGASVAVSGDVARAVTVFAAALVLVATADATRGLLRDALPNYTTAITAAMLSLYAVVLIFVVRTAYRVGSGATADDETADDGDAASEEGETEEGATDEEAADGEETSDGGDGSDGEDGDGGEGGDEAEE